ncbi:NAD-dependent epimerase/dehydratase family protein [Chloroflexota bacterium]
MAYLVTGGTGYLGSYVVRDLLNEGKEVVCLQRSGVTPVAREIIGEDNIDRIKIVQGDVSNIVQLFDVIREYGIDLIVHIAYAMPPLTELKPAYAFGVNCGGMNNVLEAARLFGLKRVVWPSSAHVFGRIHEFYKKPVGDDDGIYMPNSMYGATKALNELMAKLYFDKFGTDSICFRLGLIYGIGRWHGVLGVFTELLRKAALNITVMIGEPDLIKSYLYIEDAADVIVKACDVPTTKKRVFNVIEGQYTNRQLLETIRKINPDSRVTLGKKQASKDVFLQPPKVTAIGVQAELGWQPKYSLEDGLRKVFNYFRQNEGMPLL